MRLRLTSILTAMAVSAAAAAPAALAAFPITPSKLVATPASLPVLVAPRAELRATRSPSTWAFQIAEDTPGNGRSEVARLKRGGFREGLREIITAINGTAFSAALVVADARTAR